MIQNTDTKTRISIQVSLSGYSFTVQDEEGTRCSGWTGGDKLFTTKEFQKRYSSVRISLLTHKCTLVPEHFFNPADARQILSEVVRIEDSDQVDYFRMNKTGAVIVFSNSIGESLSRVLAQTVLTEDGYRSRIMPEMYFLLESIDSCPEYNKVLASYADGYLHLVIAQGRSLMLANVFKAVDFTTAEYFIFNSMKKLQLNPEVTTICFRTPVTQDQEISLYRYFKAVEKI
ncbi:MAG: DUF3822 family protein [Candidatus Cryptobacteroides sp.]